jgi:chemotaxis signal transduction protein
LPSAPDGIIGVASVRGRMTLVMDLSLGETLNRPKRRLILLKGESQLGLLADHIEGVVALDPKKLRAANSSKRKSNAPEDKNAGESRWPARAYFQNESRRVPVIDVERLAEI